MGSDGVLSADYLERVYAGVLGKVIGVYLGRPFEGWTYEKIQSQLGEIRYFVNEQLGKPLIVSDDDISGTFSFIRALPDYDHTRALTPQQIGQTWLNYVIERRTLFWWGGIGNSTEHTAFLRLKQGIPAPASGSIARNGKIVAEQIGAQIFIDGWAMLCPGDPEFAADLARRAASVSHDGEALYAAQVIAAMAAYAFVEPNLNQLLDTAVALIPQNSRVYRLIADIRAWHAAEPDWRKTRAQIAAHYGYDRYGGNCHIVPNHALIIHALLHGEDSFQKSLMIVNTCGWDTDCNSGNVGCLLGIKNGLATLAADGTDWRTPIADRMYLATADGGRAVTDAVTEAGRIVNIGRALNGAPPLHHKSDARFHFSLPGSCQGFTVESGSHAPSNITIENVAGHSRRGARSLAIHCARLTPEESARIATPIFIPSKAISDYFNRSTYPLYASPQLCSGQTVQAGLLADVGNQDTVTCCLYTEVYGPDDELTIQRSQPIRLIPGEEMETAWLIPDTGGEPIATIGVEVSSEVATSGTVYLDYLTWDGEPNVVLRRPDHNGAMWRRAWVDAIDQYAAHWPEAFRLAQNEDRGLLIHGTREWRNYTATAEIFVQVAKAAGIAVRVQGLRRFYALLLCHDNSIKLIKALDGDQILAEQTFPWQPGESHLLVLKVTGSRLEAFVDGVQRFTVVDDQRPLQSGGVAFVCEEGQIASDAMQIQPNIE